MLFSAENTQQDLVIPGVSGPRTQTASFETTRRIVAAYTNSPAGPKKRDRLFRSGSLWLDPFFGAYE